jgi:hypothetical protein
VLIKDKIRTGLGKWYMAIGLLSVSTGLILQRASDGRLGLSEFSQGFCLGLGVVMLAASIFFNASKLRGARTEKSQR